MYKHLIFFILPFWIYSQPIPLKSGDSQTLPEGVDEIWQYYQKLIEMYPDQPLLRYNFGNLAYGIGEFQQAVEQYRDALKSDDPEAHAKIYYNLGNGFFRAGDLESSRVFYRKALELNPTDEDARVNYEIAKQMTEQSQSQQNKSQAEDQAPEQETSESSEKDSGQESNSNQDGESSTGDQESRNTDEQLSDANKSNVDHGNYAEEPSTLQNMSRAEDKLKREEAEAILNALRAGEENFIQREYRSPVPIKLEKDW